jgi:glycine cleavage system aminomethyltransferase T
VVGTLTSRTISPEYDAIALARIETAHAEDGVVVEVALGDGTMSATVAPLSVKDPDKVRPRG